MIRRLMGHTFYWCRVVFQQTCKHTVNNHMLTIKYMVWIQNRAKLYTNLRFVRPVRDVVDTRRRQIHRNRRLSSGENPAYSRRCLRRIYFSEATQLSERRPQKAAKEQLSALWYPLRRDRLCYYFFSRSITINGG